MKKGSRSIGIVIIIVLLVLCMIFVGFRAGKAHRDDETVNTDIPIYESDSEIVEASPASGQVADSQSFAS